MITIFILFSDLMMLCWDGDKTKRPNFDEIYLHVMGIFEELMASDSESLNCQYAPLNDSEYEAVNTLKLTKYIAKFCSRLRQRRT